MMPTPHPSLPDRTHLAAILYDLDGTLANTDPLHFLAWQDCLQELGIEIDEAFYQRRISGRLNPDIVADLLPQFSVVEGQQFADRKEAKFRERAMALEPLAGVRSLIQWAETQGLAQALVTNAPRENVDYILQVLQLDRSFQPVILSEEIGIGKPDPTPYKEALYQLGLRPQQAIAFEDSPSGIRSAVAAGLGTIGITSTHSSQQLTQLGASLVINDFTARNLWFWLEGDHGTTEP